jgi:hypothetical protein
MVHNKALEAWDGEAAGSFFLAFDAFTVGF